MKYYVVADVHSYLDELVRALDEKGFFSDTEPHKLILCGDLFDRGDRPLELQAFILDLMERDEVILIRGNHEDLLCEMLLHIDEYIPYIEYTHHAQNGTFDTALALAQMTKQQAKAEPNRLRSAMAQTPFMTKILTAMVDYFETEHYIFVHGWIPCDVVRVGIEEKKRYFTSPKWREAGKKAWQSARWINGMEAWKSGALERGKTIACGHFHTSWGHSHLDGRGTEWGSDAIFEPFVHDGIIALDACTVRTGQVNVLVVED